MNYAKKLTIFLLAFGWEVYDELFNHSISCNKIYQVVQEKFAHVCDYYQSFEGLKVESTLWFEAAMWWTNNAHSTFLSCSSVNFINFVCRSFFQWFLEFHLNEVTHNGELCLFKYSAYLDWIYCDHSFQNVPYY